YWKISELIVNGGLDSYILLPKNILFKIISSVLYVSAIGDLFFGLALLIFLYKASLFFILKILALSLIGSFAMLGFMVFFNLYLFLFEVPENYQELFLMQFYDHLFIHQKYLNELF
ncbi:MAG: hypothetical protein PHO80_05770, partial [Candidatus Gracilibacteria bacterium]|nr:hypothetical protein [Candidatus Gracilibacteria bacterium]